jgi:2-dehydro-3-deoxyglucarate aldolase
MHSKNLKERIANNKLTIGSWITIGHPAIPEIMSFANFDWLVIDIEHTTIDLSMVQVLISTIQSKGIAALVRVSKNEEVVIKRVLDAGADGVIIPMVNNKEDAIKAVNYSKYPPTGTRGIGLARAQGYGYEFDEYKKAVDQTVIIAQIEHYEGINNLTEILAVEGIDATIIGPYDLSGSLGMPGDINHPDVQEALNAYKQKSRSVGKPAGIHVVESSPEKVEAKIAEGFSFIAFGTDFLFLGDKAKFGMEIITK